MKIDFGKLAFGLKVAVFAGVALGASACDQKVNLVDGQIPSQYLPQAEALMGSFSGQFGHEAEVWSATLSGDRVILSSSQDLIGEGCGSSVGNLQTIWVKEKGNAVGPIVEATFAFDPGACSDAVRGRELILDFHGHDRFNVKLLDHVESIVRCGPGDGGMPPIDGGCRTDFFPVYRQGQFSRASS